MNKEQALERLTFLKEEENELLKIIEATEKISANEWLQNFLNQNFIVKLTKGYIYYYLGDQCVFQQDFKKEILWCYYYKVWKVFYDEYQMNYEQIQALHKEVVCETLNCKGFTPYFL